MLLVFLSCDKQQEVMVNAHIINIEDSVLSVKYHAKSSEEAIITSAFVELSGAINLIENYNTNETVKEIERTFQFYPVFKEGGYTLKAFANTAEGVHESKRIDFGEGKFVPGTIGPAQGHVFYLNEDNQGMEFFLPGAYAYGIYGCPGYSLNGIQDSVGSGEQNSNIIFTNCLDNNTGASYCRNLTQGGFNDWYLPSIDELILIHENYALYGTIPEGHYLSSSQLDQSNCKVLYTDGVSYSIVNRSKDYNEKIIAVRSF
jgi:hypothetical protein